MTLVSTTAALFAPFLGLLVGVIFVAVIVVTVVSAVRGNGAGAVAYFIFGLSLVTLGIGVTTAGMVTHSVSELVGPAPHGYSGAFSPPCQSSQSTSGSSAATSPTTYPILPNGSSSSGFTEFCQGIGQGGSFANEPSDNSFTSFTSDETNHYISVSVLTGLFGLTAASAYVLLWRRARRLIGDAGLGNPPIGLLPVTYGYLIAGIAVLSLLVFVPVFADNVFRAIAPGVNETSGHADGVRNLVTYFVLAALSGYILRYHLRFLHALRNPTAVTTPPTGPDDDPPPPLGWPSAPPAGDATD